MATDTIEKAVVCGIEPVKKKRITKQYINEVTTWGVNQAKWKAAEEFCLDRGWQFMLMTEDHLGL